MSKNLLHVSKLEEFKAWLDAQGIEHRPGKGDFQVLQVRMKHNGFAAVYERLEMPEHFSTDRRLDGLVARFCRSRRSTAGPRP